MSKIEIGFGSFSSLPIPNELTFATGSSTSPRSPPSQSAGWSTCSSFANHFQCQAAAVWGPPGFDHRQNPVKTYLSLSVQGQEGSQVGIEHFSKDWLFSGRMERILRRNASLKGGFNWDHMQLWETSERFLLNRIKDERRKTSENNQTLFRLWYGTPVKSVFCDESWNSTRKWVFKIQMLKNVTLKR